MPSAHAFVPLLMAQCFGRQQLARTPEPSQATESAQNVIQYDRVLSTKLAVAYAAGFETVYRARAGSRPGAALDLACGPGHYTVALARYLDYPSVVGLDLSAPMVRAAQANAPSGEPGQAVRFEQGDATDLSRFESGEFDLASFTDAAHHMPDVQTVACVLREMDRTTRPDGLIMVMDLVRLRAERLTENYVEMLAHDYVQRGLPQFFEDFRNSMYAAWTPEELRQAIPRDSRRYWCHIVPRGLPTIQIVLGLPVRRKAPFVRRGWKVREHPLIREWFPRWEREVGGKWARETLSDLRILRLTLQFGSRTIIPPGTALAVPRRLPDHNTVGRIST